MKPVLVDAGFLVAVYNKSESHHARCMRALAAIDAPMVTCEAVIAESLHLLGSVHGAAQAILASIEQGGLEVPFKLAESSSIVMAIMKKYADRQADFADACLIALGDELDTGDILTLDSDFKHYRWRRTRAFRMLIPLD